MNKITTNLSRAQDENEVSRRKRESDIGRKRKQLIRINAHYSYKKIIIISPPCVRDRIRITIYSNIYRIALNTV